MNPEQWWTWKNVDPSLSPNWNDLGYLPKYRQRMMPYYGALFVLNIDPAMNSKYQPYRELSDPHCLRFVTAGSKLVAMFKELPSCTFETIAACCGEKNIELPEGFPIRGNLTSVESSMVIAVQHVLNSRKPFDPVLTYEQSRALAKWISQGKVLPLSDVLAERYNHRKESYTQLAFCFLVLAGGYPYGKKSHRSFRDLLERVKADDAISEVVPDCVFAALGGAMNSDEAEYDEWEFHREDVNVECFDIPGVLDPRFDCES